MISFDHTIRRYARVRFHRMHIKFDASANDWSRKVIKEFTSFLQNNVPLLQSCKSVFRAFETDDY